MRKRMLSVAVFGGLAMVVGAMTFWSELATAQSGSSSRGSGRRSATVEEFHRDFWKYITKTSPYKNWKPFPGQDAGLYEGQSPHGAWLRMYANGIAAGDARRLPHGSIIVKENYGEDKTTLMAVTVMYRVPDYDKDHFDWYWIKYRPDGTVDVTPKAKGEKPIAGRFASCISCHDGAKGGDFTFAND